MALRIVTVGVMGMSELLVAAILALGVLALFSGNPE
jgi:hypothetical protein